MSTAVATDEPPDGPAWLSTAAAADYLGISIRTLYKRVDQDGLPAYRMGRVIRLRLADVDRWLEEHRIEPGDLGHLYPD